MMEDWKVRLLDEYRQTKERYEKLKKFNNKREISYRCEVPGEYENLERTEAAKQRSVERTRTDLLVEQQRAMGNYLHFLELRMELEGIEY